MIRFDMAGITCKICGVKKLTSEMASDNISEKCDHPSLICLRCMLGNTTDKLKCPFPGCDITTAEENTVANAQKYERKFIYLFGKEALSHQTFTVEACTGHIFKFEYDKHKTIEDIKVHLIEELTVINVHFTHSGIRFSHKGRLFDEQHKQLTMEHAKIKPEETIYVQLLHVQLTDIKECEVVSHIEYSEDGEARLQTIQSSLQTQEDQIKQEIEQIKDSGYSDVYSHLPPDVYAMETLVAKVTEDKPEYATKKTLLKNVQDQIKHYKREHILHGTCLMYNGLNTHGILPETVSTKTPLSKMIKLVFDRKIEDGKMSQRCKISLNKLPKEVTSIVFLQSVFGTSPEIIVDISCLKNIQLSLLAKKECMWSLSVNEDRLSSFKGFHTVIVCVLFRDGINWKLIYSGKPCRGTPGNPDAPSFRQLQMDVEKFISDNHLF